MTHPQPSENGSATVENAAPSLRASVRDGMAHAVMLGFGETYLSAYGVFLRASNIQIGVLASLPQLIGALSQMAGVWSMRLFDRRRSVLVRAARLNSFVWVLVAMLPFVIGPGPAAAVSLIVLSCMLQASFGFPAPIWSSLIGDLVPAEGRGKFFGLRSRNSGFCTFVGLVTAGQVLHFADSHGVAAYGFCAIFLVAAAARRLCAYYLSQHDDPPHPHAPQNYFSLWDFLRRSFKSNFARFVYYIALVNFAIFFSGPYFVVYMLRVLELSYREFTALTAVSTVAQFLAIRYWGRLSDTFGNKKILNLSGFGVAIVPFLWLVSGNFWYLCCVQTFNGLMWAGFTLATANFLFDAVSPGKRARCAAYQALMNGCFVFAGSMLGGAAVSRLPEMLPLVAAETQAPSPILSVILVSGIIRLAVGAFLLPRFKEVRPVAPIRHRELFFRITGLRPIAGVAIGIFTGPSRRKE